MKAALEIMYSNLLIFWLENYGPKKLSDKSETAKFLCFWTNLTIYIFCELWILHYSDLIHFLSFSWSQPGLWPKMRCLQMASILADFPVSWILRELSLTFIRKKSVVSLHRTFFFFFLCLKKILQIAELS